MKKTMIMPRSYIQGNGVIYEIGIYVKKLGDKPILIWDEVVRNIVSDILFSSFKERDVKSIEVIFSGECTKNEAKRIKNIALKECADVIVGIGGGKTLDMSKVVASFTNNPNIIIPTSASTDAPTSSYTIWHNDQGNNVGYDKWNFNPDMVLVDTHILAKSPVRMFIAGMGDALATWYEANACFNAGIDNFAGGSQTLTVMDMARLCLDTLIEYGKAAKISIEKQIVTPAFEKVVEAIILMSGIGWESGGISTAHSLESSLHIFFPEVRKLLHGEGVAFGLACQMCLEKSLVIDEINKIIDFMIEIGLPVSFNDLNLSKLDFERILKFAESVMKSNPAVRNHNFKVTAESLASAIILADSLGNSRNKLK
jgi:glycerol dehydrogenase